MAGDERPIAYVKYHDTARCVAICDTDLLGKTLREPDTGAEVRLSDGFYGGDPVTETELRNIIRTALARGFSLNIVGERSVSVARSLGVVAHGERYLIDENERRVPHVIIVMLGFPYA